MDVDTPQDSPSPPEQSASGDLPPILSRGNACLPCRKRKMKCDGARPVCGQCTAKRRPDDCEYTTGQGLTRSQMLEENIALLETRIRELENRDTSAPSVRLMAAPQAPPMSPTTAAAALEASEASGASGSPDTITLKLVNIPEKDTKHEEQSDLIDVFLPHARQLGFFLHVARFIRTFHEQHQPVASGPFDTLLSAVCLWGSKWSDDASLHALEETLLSEATQRITDSLFVSSSTNLRDHSVLYIIQAEVLLAKYFFYNGRNLEGRYHASAAGALVLSCRLNLVLSDTMPSGSEEPEAGLAAPEDSAQLGERIHAFWTVYVLDKTWSVSLGFPTAIPAESALVRVDTPWPASLQAYDEGRADVDVTRHDTLLTFLQGCIAAGVAEGEEVTLALHAQAAALFAKAAYMGSQYRENVGQSQLYTDVLAFDEVITKFSSTLVPVLDLPPQGVTTTSEHIFIRALARVALIRLHCNFKRQQQRSRDACIAAADSALAVIRELDLSNAKLVDPIMAFLVATICQIYLDEINNVKIAAAAEADQATTIYVSYNDLYLNTLTASVQHAITIMSVLGRTCPIMAMKAIEVQQGLSAAL